LIPNSRKDPQPTQQLLIDANTATGDNYESATAGTVFFWHEMGG
jgi:hypothetical protein